jgi:tetratricopeptide (TPR) repeat protein
MNDFRTIGELFLAALEIAPAQRAAFLDQKCAGDPVLRAEVASLLSFDTDKSSPLSSIVEAGAAGLLDCTANLGARVGPYLIRELIGHGGMGSVYRASRVDEQFSREVAVKFIRMGMDTPASVGRFLRERQILANLDHPYIGRLLDGGTTDQGIPYFVMEYIHGTPIDVFAEKNNLSVEARCELFRRVCEAVSYAHRNLVVHRDLKPPNVLVKDDGTPVLLDFGIAKLMDEAAAADRTGTGMLTPDYASPEQLLGKSTTTATDVYSLGVVFYQLLTGSKPFVVESTAAVEMARTICEDTPPLPSSIAGRLRLSGDLDNIILMALRKEPERRYSSVDQFSEDVQRYLKGLPVIAREDTFAYRATKFLQRNRAAVAATTLVAAALVGAVMATSYEAHRANLALLAAEGHRARAEKEHATAEQQRELAARSEKVALRHADEAERERKNARKRLTEIVDLSRHSLFDVQGTLEHLSGALEARRDIIVTTRKYLDGLAADNENDPTILAMLVTGYTQTGDVLGVPARSNLGDPKGAREAWKKARQVLARLEKLQPGDKLVLLQDLGLHQREGMLCDSENDIKGALREYDAALAVARKLARGFPKDALAVVQTGIVEHNLGALLARQKDPAAADHVRAEVREYQRASDMAPDNVDIRLGLATAISALGQNLVSQHQLNAGLERYRLSLSIRDELFPRAPHDSIGNAGRAGNMMRIATVLGAPWVENLGDRPGAAEYAARAVEIFEALSATDPADQRARGELARALVYAGGISDNAEQLRRGIAILTQLRAEDPNKAGFRTDLNLANQLMQKLEARNLP